MADFIYITGPTGRALKVDSEGRLLCNASAATSGFILGYGEKGYPLVVDGTGHLLVNVSGISVSGGGYPSAADYLYYGPDRNAAFGPGALENIDTGGSADNNVAIGYNAGNYITVEDRNILIGAYAMANVTGNNNVIALGDLAANQGSGGGSVIIGNQAGRFNNVVGAGNNVFIGNNVALNVSKKKLVNCMALGPYAMEAPTKDLTNATAIGYQAIASGDNTIRLGRSNVTVECEKLRVENELIVVNGTIPKIYRTIINGEDLAGPSGAFWVADVSHNLGQQYVLAQFYDPATNQSSGVNVEHEYLSINKLRIFAAASGDIGVIITG